MASAKDNVKLHIVQPVVPVYRKKFFEELNSSLLGKYEVILYASPTDPNNVRSCGDLRGGMYKSVRTISIFGKLFCQKGFSSSVNFCRGDIVVLSNNLRYISNIYLILLAKIKGIKLVLWGHGKTYDRSMALRIARWLYIQMADSVLLYYENEVNEYIQRGYDPKKIFSIENSIDTRNIQIVKERIDRSRVECIRRELKMEKNDFCMVFLGRVTEKSRVDLLVETMKKVETGVHLVIIGEGGQELKKGAPANVHFIGSCYEEESLAPYFLVSDLFVYPGDAGLSVLHGLAYGLPVLTHSNRAAHMPEASLLRDNYNALFFRQGDLGSLHGCIMSLVNNRELLANLKSNVNKEPVNYEYSLENMVKKFIAAVI